MQGQGEHLHVRTYAQVHDTDVILSNHNLGAGLYNQDLAHERVLAVWRHLVVEILFQRQGHQN